MGAYCLVCDAFHRRVCCLHRMHRKAPQWSANLLQRLCNALQCTATHCGLSVCLSDRIRHRDKMAEWIRMPLGMVVGVGPSIIGMLNFGGHRRRGRGSFGRGESLGHSTL